MGLLITFLLMLSVIWVSATPANVTTKTYDTPYGPMTIGEEPRGRGTFGIVLSCTLTFAFCIWTAVHPDIQTGASVSTRIMYKAYLMSLSITLPEAIAVFAFGQWREANVLLSEWRLKMQVPKPSWTERLQFWKTDDDGFGLEGAFFVLMGGFVVDLEIPGNVTSTLTPNGFLKYLDEGYIHKNTFDRASIADKGKSSTIAKLIAGSQALWFMVQCVSRWWVGLPLTLLEIHVGIQVLDTAVLYAFWWSKPLDVNTPIKIVLRLQDESQKPSSLTITPDISQLDRQLEEEKTNEQLLDRNSPPHSFHTSPAIDGFLAALFKGCHNVVIYMTPRPLGKSNQDSRLATVAIYFEGGMSVVNGALHAAAWNSKFPTLIECWLWRASSIGVFVFPALVVYTTVINMYHLDLDFGLQILQQKKRSLFGFLFIAGRELGRCIKRHATSNGRVSIRGCLEHTIKLTFHFTVMFCYIFAISFITWESYSSLRSPADGTFLTPRWVGYWPHV